MTVNSGHLNSLRAMACSMIREPSVVLPVLEKKLVYVNGLLKER